MEARIDPRGNLPSTMIQPLSYIPRPISSLFDSSPQTSSSNTLQKPRRDLCYDWIFSSSSNVHVAIDRAAFISYQPFESYALTLSDQSRVVVRGIGTVELRVRCKPGSRSHRSIFLENVLHIPNWLCNIFSDIYFQNIAGFEFTWNEFGVSFAVRVGDKLKPWGYTENFYGLDKLVLGRRQDGRSPMLEDKDREIFAVNITWPQSQIDKWEDWLRMQSKQSAQEDISNEGVSTRARLSEINGNVVLKKKDPAERTSTRSLSQFAKKLT